MSLRSGKHRVTVIPRVGAPGPRGVLIYKDGEPTDYQVNVQPVSSAEKQDIGLTVDTVYRVKYFPQVHLNKPWTGGAYSKIIWDGREFEQIGEAMQSSMSPRTGHLKILMRARGAEAK